jgi:putative tricarboxylic transport membrane protein
LRNKDTYSALFWLAIGAGVFYEGYDLGKGNLYNPGPGFIFFWVGLIMIGLSLIILVQDMLRKPSPEEMTSVWSGIRWKKILCVLISLILYAYFFTFLGFLLSTTILLIFLFKAVGSQRWSVAIIGAISSALVAYLVFYVWLGSQLPKGFMEIG